MHNKNEVNEMLNKQINANAVKALEQMKLEIANEMGLADSLNNLDPIENIFTAGPVGGMMTRNLVEMGQRKLMEEHKEQKYKIHYKGDIK